MAITPLRQPSNTRPALWLFNWRGMSLAVKDYRCNGALFRNTAGRFLVWREARALTKLQGLPGVPRLHGKVNGLALIMDAVPGRTVEGLEHEAPLSLFFFNKLRALINEIHARGIAHCDLKRAPNILVGQGDTPYIVDWSAAISSEEFGFFPLSIVYRRFVQDDLNAVIKLQLKHRPREIPQQELEIYHRRGPVEQRVRRIRDQARRLLKRLA